MDEANPTANKAVSIQQRVQLFMRLYAEGDVLIEVKKVIDEARDAGVLQDGIVELSDTSG